MLTVKIFQSGANWMQTRLLGLPRMAAFVNPTSVLPVKPLATFGALVLLFRMRHDKVSPLIVSA